MAQNGRKIELCAKLNAAEKKSPDFIVKLVSFEMEEHKMANNQSQSSNSSSSQNSSKTQSSQSTASASKPQTHSASSSTQSQSSSSPSTSSDSATRSSMNSGSGSGDMIEQTIAKGVNSLLQTLEPQLNRIGTQIINRAMSRGQNFADTGVKRMQDQPWYMVGGALALVAVGVGLLFAFDADSSPEFPSSNNNVQ